MAKLYFWDNDRQYALEMVALYSAGFSTRVLAAFDDIEAKAAALSAAMEAYHNARINEPVGDNDHYRDDADKDLAHAAGVYEELEFVRRQVTGLAVAGLYHLWERLLKRFVIQELVTADLRWRQPYNVILEVYKYDFKQLTTLISDNGWDIKAEDFYRDLYSLCLVANVVKHGNGRSCEELLKTAPEFFRTHWLSSPVSGRPSSAEELSLDARHFERFTQAVRAFFRQFPGG
jgi:hypothetical protein